MMSDIDFNSKSSFTGHPSPCLLSCHYNYSTYSTFENPDGVPHAWSGNPAVAVIIVCIPHRSEHCQKKRKQTRAEMAEIITVDIIRLVSTLIVTPSPSFAISPHTRFLGNFKRSQILSLLIRRM